MVSCDTAMSDLQKEATLKDNKIINSVIEELQDFSLHVVPDQLFSLLAKYQVPPEKQVKLLIQTATELQSRGGDVKEDKEAYTKFIKLSSIISCFVAEKYGNSTVTDKTTVRKGRKAKDNAVTNMTSYFTDIVPTLDSDDENKIPETVVWSDSELTELPITVKKEEKTEEYEEEEKKIVDVVTKMEVEPKREKISAEDALLEELLDDGDEDIGKDIMKDEIIKDEPKTEPCCDEIEVAGVKTKTKRERRPVVSPEKNDADFKKWATRPGRSTRARAPEVVCIDSSSGDEVPVITEDVELDTIEAKPIRKKRGAVANTGVAKRAKPAKKPVIQEPVEVVEEEPEEELEEDDEYVPEAYEVVKSEEEDDEEIPDLDDAESDECDDKDDLSSKYSPTKERPVGVVRATQRAQKKTPTTPDTDEIEGDTVIVNFNKDNIPSFENSYSHIVLADKPEPGLYADDDTTPTVTEVLALSTCKIIRAPDMSLFELLQLVHGTEGQYLVATREDGKDGKDKKYHLLIPGVINDTTSTKLAKLKS